MNLTLPDAARARGPAAPVCIPRRDIRTPGPDEPVPMRRPGTLADVLFPARDEPFGSLIRRLSEPESGPHADNFLTNEDSFPRVCDSIARDVPADGVYLGVGPDQNLTYIAHARPSLAFILDFRRRNLLVHLLHKALVALSPSRSAYLSRLAARRPAREPGPDADADALVAASRSPRLDRDLLATTTAEVAEYLRPFDVVREAEWDELSTIQARLAGPGLDARFLALPIYPTLGDLIRTPDRRGRPAHMLASESTYRSLREAHLGDRVLPLVGDLAGSTAMPRLASFLRDRGLSVTLIYVSDVEFFLLRDGADRFTDYAANLARLPLHTEAKIIRTSTREIDHPDRVAGDRSTTIIRPLAPFLDAAQAGRVRSVDDLFAP